MNQSRASSLNLPNSTRTLEEAPKSILDVTNDHWETRFASCCFPTLEQRATTQKDWQLGDGRKQDEKKTPARQTNQPDPNRRKATPKVPSLTDFPLLVHSNWTQPASTIQQGYRFQTQQGTNTGSIQSFYLCYLSCFSTLNRRNVDDQPEYRHSYSCSGLLKKSTPKRLGYQSSTTHSSIHPSNFFIYPSLRVSPASFTSKTRASTTFAPNQSAAKRIGGRIKRMTNRCLIRPSNQSRPLPRCCGIPLRPKGSLTITNATSTTPWGSQPEPAQPSTFPQPQVYGYQDSKSITRQIICDLRLHLSVGPDVGFPEAPIAFIASHTLH
ncbi:uncharacterized protein CLUP02_01074 [Colletotrichum lupini]|uniref:Uncharacterized protein n=1 Tax=Colletotrichum lupini TaxID=145971 RepID=A0A9Q8W8A0_9PEZI|nr:uncharacterized protein CLUP02_01074 [Colletotrichum lupini]UQC74423.1 hypothetical protein CLUP02_01074 [Colletotrichum lupini]